MVVRAAAQMAARGGSGRGFLAAFALTTNGFAPDRHLLVAVL
jgi:hypothetical protein